MTTIIRVSNRILLRNGSYLAIISAGKIVTIFENKDVAKSTFVTMKNAESAKDLVFSYDQLNTIIQELPNMTEEEIVINVKAELDSAVKSRNGFLQKISYTVCSQN
jgi:hypothetical protein